MMARKQMIRVYSLGYIEDLDVILDCGNFFRLISGFPKVELQTQTW